MRRAIASSILIFAGLAADLAAQAPIDDPRVIRDGAWNRSLPAAQSAARYTGRPLLVFFYEDWCGYCEQVEKLLSHPEMAQAGRRFILVKTSVEENEEFARKWRIDLHHQIVMLDWSGNLLAKVTEFTSEKDVATSVIEAAAANDMLAGRKLMELSYYGKAAERFRTAAKVTRDPKRQEEAKKALDDIADRAKRQLEVIREMIRKERAEEALDALSAFVKDFPPDMGVDEARKLIAQLRSGRPAALPDERPVVVVPGPETKRAPEEEAKRLLDKGMVYEWDKNYLDAIAAYRKAARDYPGTAAAAEADKRAKMFLDDPATRAALAKQQMDSYCRRMLEMGELYERNNRDDEAIVRYRSILAVYPDSDWADEAQKRLNEIERRHLK